MARQAHHSSNYGGRRPGAGKPFGAKNKFQKRMMELTEKYDVHPVELLLDVVNDESENMNVRLNAAVHVLPYVAPKMGAVDPASTQPDEVDQMTPTQKMKRINSLVAKIAERRPALLESDVESKGNGAKARSNGASG